MMSIGERVALGRIDARDGQPIAAIVVPHADTITRCRVRDLDGCPVVGVADHLNDCAMVFHVNPLDCATAAARRVLATTVAIAIKNAITELDRIGHARIVLLLD